MSLISETDPLKVLNLLETSIKWVKCPFCDDEVSRLRPCRYWREGREVCDLVCLECAESAKGFLYLAGKFPLEGVDVSLELMPIYKKMDPKYTSEKSFKAKIFYGEWIFWAYPRTSRMVILEDRKTPDLEKTYENTFQAWFAIKNIFENGKVEEEEKPKKKKTWGKMIYLTPLLFEILARR